MRIKKSLLVAVTVSLAALGGCASMGLETGPKAVAGTVVGAVAVNAVTGGAGWISNGWHAVWTVLGGYAGNKIGDNLDKGK